MPQGQIQKVSRYSSFGKCSQLYCKQGRVKTAKKQKFSVNQMQQSSDRRQIQLWPLLRITWKALIL